MESFDAVLICMKVKMVILLVLASTVEDWEVDDLGFDRVSGIHRSRGF